MVWHGVYAPKGTPREIVAALNAALRKAIGDLTVQARFAAVGTEAFPDSELTPAIHAARLAREVGIWADVVKKSGLSIGN